MVPDYCGCHSPLFTAADGGVADQVCGLGSSMLQMVFKLHRVAQQEILSRLLNKIITGGTTPAVQYYFSEWAWLLQ